MKGFYFGETYSDYPELVMEFHCEIEYFKKQKKFLMSQSILKKNVKKRIKEIEKEDKKIIMKRLFKTFNLTKLDESLFVRLSILGNLILKKDFLSFKLRSKDANKMLECLSNCQDIKIEKIKNLAGLILRNTKNKPELFFKYIKSFAKSGDSNIFSYLKNCHKDCFMEDSEKSEEKSTVLKLKENLLEILQIQISSKTKMDLDQWTKMLEEMSSKFNKHDKILKGFEVYLEYIVNKKQKFLKDLKNRQMLYSFSFNDSCKISYEFLFENILTNKHFSFLLKILMELYKNIEKYDNEISIFFEKKFEKELLNNEDFYSIIKKSTENVQLNIFKDIKFFKSKIIENLNMCCAETENKIQIIKDMLNNDLLILCIKTYIDQDDKNIIEHIQNAFVNMKFYFLDLLNFFEEKVINDNENKEFFKFLLVTLIDLYYKKIEKTKEICKVMISCQEVSSTKRNEIHTELISKLQSKANFIEIINNFKILYQNLKGKNTEMIDIKILNLKFNPVDLQNSFKKEKLWTLILQDKDNLNAFEINLAYNLFEALHKGFKTDKDFSQELMQETFRESVDIEDELPDENELNNPENKDNKDNGEDGDRLVTLKLVSSFNKRFFRYFKEFIKNRCLEKENFKKINLYNILKSDSKTKKQAKPRRKKKKGPQKVFF